MAAWNEEKWGEMVTQKSKITPQTPKSYHSSKPCARLGREKQVSDMRPVRAEQRGSNWTFTHTPPTRKSSKSLSQKSVDGVQASKLWTKIGNPTAHKPIKEDGGWDCTVPCKPTLGDSCPTSKFMYNRFKVPSHDNSTIAQEMLELTTQIKFKNT